MSRDFNYRHLYYFWVVAKEGGVARGAERLGMAVQTVSTQLKELERQLGFALFKPVGRKLALTEAGQAALQQAEQIFQLGEALPDIVRNAGTAPSMRLAVGISDSLPKLVVHRLMQSVLQTPNLQLRCQQNAFDALLADLALHRLDLVITDRPAPPNRNLKLYGHALGHSAVAWYAPDNLLAAACEGFPQSLAKVAVLLPSAQAALRLRLDQWFERQGIRPHVVGEFEDSALLKTFGANGMGVFPAAEMVHDELISRYGVRWVGTCTGVEEHFYGISADKHVMHPLVQRLLPAPPEGRGRAPK